MTFALRTLIVLVLLAGFFYAIAFIRVPPPVVPAAVVLAPPPLPVPSTDTFNAAGTIEYTSNGEGDLVPYLIYKRANGAVASKAIVFGNDSNCVTHQGSYPCALIHDALRVYFGAGPVHLVGTTVAEHVVVTTMSLA